MKISDVVEKKQRNMHVVMLSGWVASECLLVKALHTPEQGGVNQGKPGESLPWTSSPCLQSAVKNRTFQLLSGSNQRRSSKQNVLVGKTVLGVEVGRSWTSALAGHEGHSDAT